MLNCLGCGNQLDDLYAKAGLHPLCNDPQADLVKEELSALIHWASDNSARSLQTKLGPSELGHPCDRRLAYALAGSPQFNEKIDPLIAVVGTGIHWWLEQAIRKFNATYGETWIPEKHVDIDEVTSGTSDLYHPQLRAVVDFKSAGTDVIKKVPDVGPSDAYRTQVHLYGMGYTNAGLPVDSVMIAYIPRSGLLKSIFVWREPFDYRIAEAALARRDGLANMVASKPKSDLDFNAFMTNGVTAKDCWFCPYKGKDMLMGATAQFGCPGM